MIAQGRAGFKRGAVGVESRKLLLEAPMKRFSTAVLAALIAAIGAAAPAAGPLIIPVTAGMSCHTQGFTVLGDSK